ncbi:response regulator [Geomonas sp. Red32]|uniref:response regulator n=1 Tax=Geomonas sp. Red32 TaxID=2912856 RepID=UPI00202CEAA0|nr:response regulator [Geomonas sp. Red32]MCM0083132.1 response regulator [Geomonas sp. Red32]
MKRKVMIVDDVADIRVMLRYILEKEDYTIVAEAANGVEAVEKYREHLPDITIMDIDMPYMTGVEAAQEIREMASDARIIFCSAGNSKYEEILRGIPAKTIIKKPFMPAQLYQAMAM